MDCVDLLHILYKKIDRLVHCVPFANCLGGSAWDRRSRPSKGNSLACSLSKKPILNYSRPQRRRRQRGGRREGQDWRFTEKQTRSVWFQRLEERDFLLYGDVTVFLERERGGRGEGWEANETPRIEWVKGLDNRQPKWRLLL